MIDDQIKTKALMRKMEAHMPIPTRPTVGLVRTLRQQGINITRDQTTPIRSMFYMGDEGGIMCDVTPPGSERTPVVCSLTHIEVDPGHPLAEEIRAYQRERARKLAQSERRPAASTRRRFKRRR